MSNKEILKKIYSLIKTIDNVVINVFVEEIKENQIELHLKNKKEKKRNVEYGARIIINDNNKNEYNSISFSNYEDLFLQLKEYISKKFDIKSKHKKIKVNFKKIKSKNVDFNSQHKYKIMYDVMKKLTNYDCLKVAIYEKKENIFIIQNIKDYIVNINNFYTKIMLKGKIQDNEIFDFILSDCGYKNITKKKIDDIIEKFKKTTYIKTNKKNISDGIYDLVLSNNCGTVFHEMFGHNLEFDLANKSKSMLFRIGSNLNNKLISFADCTSHRNLLSLKYDDSASKTCSKNLISKGIIRQYITTLRTENYKFFPTTRMTNSYLVPNKKTRLFDFEKVKNGIYAFKIGKGRLYLEEQKFEITIDAGYLIKNGKIVGNISDVKFTVKVSEFIKKIDYIGSDLNFVPTICGASSGNIFAYAGTPTVCVKDIYIVQEKTK